MLRRLPLRAVRQSSTVARSSLLARWRDVLLERWRSAGEPMLAPQPPPPTRVVSLPPLSIVTAYEEEEIEAAVESLWARRPAPGRPQSLRFLGLDTETAPQFVRGGARKRTATLQVSDARDCLVASLHLLPLLPPSLQALLADQHSVFVGVGVGEDLSKLLFDYSVPVPPGGGPRWVDLAVVATLFLHEKPGLKGLSDAFDFPLVKSKSVQLSNWERRPLREAQVSYAAQDAQLSLWLLQALHVRHGAASEPSLERWAAPFIGARMVGEVRAREGGRHLAEALRVYEAKQAASVREREVRRELAAVLVGLADPARSRSSLQAVGDLRRCELVVEAKADAPLGIDMPPLRVCTVKLGGVVLAKALGKTRERAEAKAVREALLTLQTQLTKG